MRHFDQEALENFARKFDLNNATRDVIRECWRAPARHVRPGKRNVKSTIPCPKMGFALKVESNLERAVALDHLFNDAIVGYFEQPAAILHLKYQRSDGRSIRVASTADFMALDENEGPYIEECKPRAILEALVKADPVRYVLDGEVYRSPPAEEAARRYSMKFRIVDDHAVPLARRRNHEFLRDYLFRGKGSPLDLADVTARAAKFFGCSEFREGLDFVSAMGRDDAFAAIAYGLVFFDMDVDFLGHVDQLSVYRTREARDELLKLHRKAVRSPRHQLAGNILSGDQIAIDGLVFTVAAATGQQVFLVDGAQSFSLTRGELQIQLDAGRAELLDAGRLITTDIIRASAAEIKLAELRLLYVRGSQDAAVLAHAASMSDTSRGRWKSVVTRAERVGRDPMIALLKRDHAKGNRTSRLPDEVTQAVKEHIHRVFLTPQNVSMKLAHADYLNQVEATPWLNVGPSTYRRFVRAIPADRARKSREGAKRSYQIEKFDFLLEEGVDRHGLYPFAVVHIDHTPFDHLSASSQLTGEDLKLSPILTLAVDGYTRCVVGWYLSLQVQPDRSCALNCLLTIVRDHKKLPATIVVDGGKDFMSADIERICASKGTCIRSRQSKPRGGSIVERAFGMTTKQFADNLWGGKKLQRYWRQISPNVDPKLLAVIPFGILVEALGEYIHVVNTSWRNSSHFMTAEAKMQQGLREMGARSRRQLTLDMPLLVQMQPTAVARRAVDPQRGFELDYHLYYHERFFFGGQKHHEVTDVKRHPFDASIAYARFAGEWLECRCRNLVDITHPLQKLALREEMPHLQRLVNSSHDEAYRRYAAIVQQTSQWMDVSKHEAQAGKDVPADSTNESAIVPRTDDQRTSAIDEVPPSVAANPRDAVVDFAEIDYKPLPKVSDSTWRDPI